MEATNLALKNLMESGLLGVLLALALIGIGLLLRALISSYKETIERQKEDINLERSNTEKLISMINTMMNGQKDVIKSIELLNQKTDSSFNSLPCKFRGQN